MLNQVKRNKPISLFILFFSSLFILPNIVCSQNYFPGYKYNIPQGQYLYTTNPKKIKDLKPYKLEYQETFNSKTTQIIEVGDFTIREQIKDSIVVRDTLCFTIEKIRINGKDTIRESEKLGFRKKVIYRISAKLDFKKDKIYVTQSPKHQAPSYSAFNKLKNSVAPDDQDLYFQLDNGDVFRFNTSNIWASIISIPYRARFKPENETGTAAEFKLDNIEFFLGLKHTSFKYNHGKLKNTSIGLGAYFGPTVIKLTEANTSFDLHDDDENFRAGVTYGLGLMGTWGKFNFGVAIGNENIVGDNDLHWIYDSKGYFGIIAGYGFN